MIRGECVHYNGWDASFKLGEWTWPTEFVAVPKVGEWVESWEGKFVLVVAVAHSTDSDKQPFVKVFVCKVDESTFGIRPSFGPYDFGRSRG